MKISRSEKLQEKRRHGFKSQAKKCFKTFNSNTFKRFNKELKDSKYKEWNEDYYAMLSQGKKIKALNTNEFRVFVQAVYGWMPVLYSQQSIRTLKYNLLKIMTGKEFNREIVKAAADCFISSKHSAGSISAFSKTLHFCSPEKYPVWDTRVARALGRKTGTGNNIDVYLDYLSIMSELNSDVSLDGYYKDYRNTIDPKATKLRSLEHGLYFKGKK